MNDPAKPMLHRRRFLLAATTLAAAPLLAHAQSDPRRLALLREITGGPLPAAGRVLVDTPPLADNGHSVPVRIAVESPMSAADRVQQIVILAERNPRPVVARYALGPLCARAEISTRIRLADIQEVVALARMSDGGWWMGATRVIVTELACLEDG
ncbi:MAG: thiosulfate oxidation carrier protein SoxY [Betaproteobacteria bacterium]|nr:sulfur oxidation protein SoxY [Betaproteobacteria bacterium]